MWSVTVPQHVFEAAKGYLETKARKVRSGKKKPGTPPFFPKFISPMSLLKKISKNLVLQDVIRNTIPDKKAGEMYWKVFILDHFSSKIVSHCCGMHDITAEGVTLVEDLHKRREPLPFLEAIYLLKPTDEDSVNHLLKDLESDQAPYKAFHIFFTQLCPTEVIEKCSEVKHITRVRTLKEVNISFIALESHVFLLENIPSFNSSYFNTDRDDKDVQKNLDTIARQIATLCACLDEYPSIRYRKGYDKNAKLAGLVEEKLQDYKKAHPNLGDGNEKARSQVVILDRGFDITSTVLHELTFEAMVHDLLPIENGAYKMKCSDGTEKKFYLDDGDNTSWQDLKHLHIADVSRTIVEQYKEFLKSKNMEAQNGQIGEIGIRELQMMVKKMPQYQKEMNQFATQMNMVDECLQYHKKSITDICTLEQDLATGIDVQGEKIKDVMNQLIPLLLNERVSDNEKLRLIILYAMSRKGITEESLKKLLVHGIPDQSRLKCQEILSNLTKLKPDLFISAENARKDVPIFDRKNEEPPPGKQYYTTARWTPLIKDVAEFVIEDNLDRNKFPFHSNRNGLNGMKLAQSSRSYGTWYPRGNRTVPRLILFVVGGVTLSEIRSVYEVNKEQSDWEVIIGSTEVLTPNTFLNNLGEL